MWIKILLIVGVVVAGGLLTRATGGARHQALRRILLAVFILAAAASVLFPTTLTWLANRVGVGRGSDLLLYALVIAFLSFISTSYRRMSHMSRDITTLTREITLLRTAVDKSLHNSSTAVPPDGPGSSSSTPYDSERD